MRFVGPNDRREPGSPGGGGDAGRHELDSPLGRGDAERREPGIPGGGGDAGRHDSGRLEGDVDAGLRERGRREGDDGGDGGRRDSGGRDSGGRDPGGNDPVWVHRSPLQSVGVWILVAGAAFGVHAVWTFAREHQRAEQNVRIVRESKAQWIRHEGRVHTQEEIVSLLRRRPYWRALPYAVLTVLMGVCTWVANHRPVAAAVTALVIAVLGGIVQMLRAPRLDVTAVSFFVFLWLILALGIRSAVGYVRVRRTFTNGL